MGKEGGSPVNKTGKIKISHMLVPLAAWIEAMPKSATSEEVSKPRPKRMPRGYIFHGLSIFVSAKNYHHTKRNGTTKPITGQ